MNGTANLWSCSLDDAPEWAGHESKSSIMFTRRSSALKLIALR